MTKRSGLGWILGATIAVVAVGCGGGEGTPPEWQVGDANNKETKGAPGEVAGVGPETENDPITNTPEVFVPLKGGRVLGPDAIASAKDFLTQNQKSLGITDMGQLGSEQTIEDDGMVHVLFQQVVNGIPVFDSHVGVHFNEDGEVAFVDGPFIPNLEAIAKSTPAVNEATAFGAAEASVRTTETAALTIAKKASAMAIFYDDETGFAALAYRFETRATMPYQYIDHDVFVNAADGKVIEDYRKLADVDEEVAAQDTTGTAHRIPVFYSTAGWTMGRNETNPNMYVGRWNKADEWVSVTASAKAGPWDAQGVEALAFATRTAEYFENQFRWSSFDNKNSPLFIAVRSSARDGLNAFASRDVIEFTRGNAEGQALSRCLDVVAHEYMHLVTENTSKMVYKGASGALNEAMSDIFGTLVERAHGGGNFIIAEDAVDGGFRDMRHPASLGYPDHWSNRLPFRGEDEGNVHSNSSIANNAFVLMTVGGRNDTSSIDVANPIGWEKARKLWWKTERSLVHAKAKFAGMAKRQVLAAKRSKNLGGLASARTVACAWRSTGVISSEQSLRYVDADCGAIPPNKI